MELPFPELVVGGRQVPLGGEPFRIEALLGADIADRLEAEFPADGELWDPGKESGTVVLRIDGAERFRGTLERIAWRLQPGAGPVAGLVARAEWTGRAGGLPPEEEYREVTDSEVAARIADSLGLPGKIEPTSRVHPLLLRRGDPLPFLRERALASSRILAVASGELHFSRALPPPARTFEIGPATPVLSLRVTRRKMGRCGSAALAFDPGVSPLDGFRLSGLGAGWADGAFRVGRIRLRGGRRSFTAEINWIEDGMDPAIAGEEDSMFQVEAGGTG